VLLDNKVAIVTGIGPGLGREIAVQFAREGAAVVLGARTEPYLEEVRAEIEDAGGRAFAVKTDIADRADCDRIVETAHDAFGGLDVIVQNGYVAPAFKMFEDVDLDEWRVAMDVNFWGTLQLAQAAIPELKARGGGSMIFVNSMIVRKVLPLQGGYAASKGALMTATQVLARELGQYKIRVNSLVPGWMWGPAVEGYFSYMEKEFGRSHDDLYSEVTANIALGVIPPDEECARGALFLASDLSSTVTGQAIDVNGGEVFH
jgi:NAD(P)-dependent dehydrogenase (short-subunit alcohol dehydrogenase family)